MPPSWIPAALDDTSAHLKEGKVSRVACETQAQHALELRRGDVDGCGVGERLDDGFRQVGGQEAQPQHKHADLQRDAGSKHT